MSVLGRWTKFKSLVDVKKEDSFVVLVTQIDPDAIGGAMGLEYLLEELGVEDVQIFYCGNIGHPQNRAAMNRYNLMNVMKPISAMKPTSAVEENSKKTTHFVLVDSSSAKDSRINEGVEVEPLIVVDHHRGSTLVETEDNFVWIEDIGAACTLVVELMQEAQVKIPEEKQYIAALLALGIHNDTRGMRCDGRRDREAFNFARNNCSTEEFYKLTDYSLPEAYFDCIGSSYLSRSRQGAKVVMGAGKINPKHGDVLSMISDECIRMDGVSLAVVHGIIDGEVRISARGDDLSNPLDDLLKKLFGENNGGAKQTFGGMGVGGAKISVEWGFFDGPEVEKEKGAVVGKKVEALIFKDS